MDTTPASSWLEGNPGVDQAQRPGKPEGHSEGCPEGAERGHAAGQGGDEDSRQGRRLEGRNEAEAAAPSKRSARQKGQVLGHRKAGTMVLGAQQ